MNMDGSDCYPVFQSQNQDFYPTWNMDGSKILFFGGPNYGSLYQQSPLENATDKIELIKFYYGDDPEWLISPSGGFSMSPGGKLVGVNSSVKLFGILGITPSVGKSGVIVLLPSTANQKYESPVFSPDGSKIAFASIITDSNGGQTVSVNSINPDGTNLTELVKVKTFDAKIRWGGCGL